MSTHKRHRRKHKKWYQTPYFRFGILAAVLVVLIILLVHAVNTRKKADSTAESSNTVSFVSSSVQETDEPGAAGEMSAASESAEISSAAEISSVSEAVSEQSSAEEAVSSVSETASGVQTVQPYPCESEDGGGQAGITALTADMAAGLTGWQSNTYGLWYSPDGLSCFYNGWQDIDGQTYHFDAEGYMDRGWKLISGQSCYFDSHGVYQPGQDNSKLLAFTFDDGPSEGTDQILAMCEEYDCRVTFFMIGRQVQDGGAVIDYINRYRCEVGNHSYSHGWNVGRDPAETKADFEQGDDFIKIYNHGEGASVVRFPYGDYTAEQTAAVGKPNILWDIDSYDWESRNVEAIKNEIYAELTGGNIILMHDPYPETIEACRQLWPELMSQGYQLVTVSELAAAHGYELLPGVTYFSFKDKNIAEGRVTDQGY